MNEEKNDQAPNDKPPPATPEIIQKGEDTEKQGPPPATSDILKFTGKKPPKAKPDFMIKMMTQADLDRLRTKKEEKK